MRSFSAVFWDMDGTLVDSEPLWSIATFEMSERLGRRLTPELRERTIGGSFRNTIAIAADHAGVKLNEQLIADNYRFTVERMQELFATRLTLNPGARELLEALRAEGVPMVLVTNTPREIAAGSIRAIGEDFFVHTVCGDEVPAGKPSPEPYLHAARLLGVDPSTCVAFEDSATGMRSAADAGCITIGLPESDEVAVPAGVRTLQQLHGSRTWVGVTPADIEKWVV